MFNPAWLDGLLADKERPAIDVARTLVEFTARSISTSIDMLQEKPDQLFVCGGGAFNGFMLERISQLTGLSVRSTSELGVHPQRVEAMAFAWMAKQTINGLPSNVPSVTGAAGARILGAIYQR
jgi:anhydro-N-acetylmuramic acid kinase